jgi:uncharacterized protein YwbE
MKKKFLIIGVLVLAVVILGVWAVPALADGASGSAPATQNTQQVNQARILVRLMVVQDEAKVDAFLAKVQAAGKITAAQVTAIKTMWTNHHAQFKPGSPLVRLLQVRDGAKVRLVLDKAVDAGKLDKTQAEKVFDLWQKVHGK